MTTAYRHTCRHLTPQDDFTDQENTRNQNLFEDQQQVGVCIVMFAPAAAAVAVVMVRERWGDWEWG